MELFRVETFCEIEISLQQLIMSLRVRWVRIHELLQPEEVKLFRFFGLMILELLTLFERLILMMILEILLGILLDKVRENLGLEALMRAKREIQKQLQTDELEQKNLLRTREISEIFSVAIRGVISLYLTLRVLSRALR